ncbi:hypothetical protein K439DRAFT_1316163, partial [Ramaria rubella]
LWNGGVLFEMDSAKSATWLNHPAIAQQFLEHFGTSSIIKLRTYPLIMEYVPLAFSPDVNASLREMEQQNNWPKGAVANARWIKPTARRHRDQHNAHIILNTSLIDTANIAIREGLIIKGKRVWARKLLQEPKHCLKCQDLNTSHIAAECRQIHDTCGTCAEMHRTSDCQVTDSSKFKWANCKTTGHAAWDWNCPKFIAANSRHQSKHPENSYRFFPSSTDHTTW